MNTEDEINVIFSALDDQNRGFIDKSRLLQAFAEYSSTADDDDRRQEIIRIKQLMEPYELITSKVFKHIFLEIQRPGSDAEDNDHEDEKPPSSESSDIDDHTPRTLNNKKSFLYSPTSAKKHGSDLINQSKATFQKTIKESSRSENGRDSHHSDVGNLQEWDGLIRDNERMVHEINELEKKLKEEEVRYRNEKDVNKVLSERVYNLESELHDLEMKYKNEIKGLTESSRLKMDRMKEDQHLQEDKWSQQLSEMRRQQDKAREDSLQAQSSSQTLTTKYDNLFRDYRLLQNQLSEYENIMGEYKRVASHQVTELQTERDELEITNKRLYLELQATKHLPRKVIDSLQTFESNETLVMNRPRVHSAIITPFNDTNRVALEETLAKNNSSTMETDVNTVVHRLSMENRDLVERIAHLETVGFYQKQKLEAANCVSLADEIDQLSLDEMRKALTVERETVKTLRDYMESMTVKLLTLGYIDVFQQC